MAARVAEFLAGWRGLGRFWMIVLAALGFAAAVLQLLGPPRTRVASSAGRAEPAAIVQAEAEQGQSTPPTPAEQAPGRATPGVVAGPDPALMETDPSAPDQRLPRIASDGRTPMHVYASGFDPATMRPRVGILIAGIGLSEADSMAAIRDLPPAATLAVSSYAGDIDRMLASARMAGHEYLLSVPMEPQGFPADDPDDRHALMTSLPADENLNRLRRVMSHI